MIKSILAVSEGGPDAVMSFRLAVRIAAIFGGVVDALHLSTIRAGEFVVGAEAMPIVVDLDNERLQARAKESERAYKELIAPTKGATYAAADAYGPDVLVAKGRCSDILVLGRPGSDPENIAPLTVNAAIHDCARPVMIAPPVAGAGPFASVIVAWNGSIQAARAAHYALPFLGKATKVTVLVVGAKPDAVGAPDLMRNLARHGITAAVDSIDPGTVSGRARGRALLRYTTDSRADLLVTGAYGQGQMMRFLGLGGATGKVISSCPIPLLMAH